MRMAPIVGVAATSCSFDRYDAYTAMVVGLAMKVVTLTRPSTALNSSSLLVAASMMPWIESGFSSMSTRRYALTWPSLPVLRSMI